MKSLRLVFSAVILVSLLIVSGCGDDADPVNPIIGKWQITKTEAKITPSSTALVNYLVSQGLSKPDAEDYVSFLMDGGNVDASGTLEIKADGTYEQIDGTDKNTGTWEYDSETKQLTIDKGTTDQQVARASSPDESILELDFDYSGDLFLPTSAGLGYHVILSFKRI